MTEPVKELLAENLSILLIDNMTNEIIGCRGLAIYKKGGAPLMHTGLNPNSLQNRIAA
jgi:hypothetical protein